VLVGGVSDCRVGTVHNYLTEAKQEANERARDLGEQIRAQENVRLLDIIDRSMAIVDAVSGQTDKHGVPNAKVTLRCHKPTSNLSKGMPSGSSCTNGKSLASGCTW
jgi:hypothetical protein